VNARIMLAGALALGAAACAGKIEPEPEPEPEPPNEAPVMSIELPDYPPIGPEGRVAVHVTDDQERTRVVATFRDRSFKSLSSPPGQPGTVFFTGPELGEGMGTLSVSACDALGLCAGQAVRNLLVDLSPPEIEIERAVASPKRDDLEGQIALWIADAWVLGSVELAFGGVVLRHELPKAYPATLGSEWDVTRVTFPARALPEQSGTARVTARDAAGNEAVHELLMHIDGTPPVAAITEPAEGSTVSGRFTVRFSASDPSAQVVSAEGSRGTGSGIAGVEVWVGGARIVEMPGPDGEVLVDAAALPPGPTEIRVIARDAAGNASAPARVVVDLQ
jgi:hypothetical protein